MNTSSKDSSGIPEIIAYFKKAPQQMEGIFPCHISVAGMRLAHSLISTEISPIKLEPLEYDETSDFVVSVRAYVDVAQIERLRESLLKEKFDTVASANGWEKKIKNILSEGKIMLDKGSIFAPIPLSQIKNNGLSDVSFLYQLKERVKNMYWLFSLKPATLGIPEGKKVKEIQFFWIDETTCSSMKMVPQIVGFQKYSERDFLRKIDLRMPYHTVFFIHTGSRTRIYIGEKQFDKNGYTVKSIKKYIVRNLPTNYTIEKLIFLIHRSMMIPDELTATGNNLDEVYENIYKWIEKRSK